LVNLGKPWKALENRYISFIVYFLSKSKFQK
jgi:hypothetical protein